MSRVIVSEGMEKDYTATIRAKRRRGSILIFKHALRNVIFVVLAH